MKITVCPNLNVQFNGKVHKKPHWVTYAPIQIIVGLRWAVHTFPCVLFRTRIKRAAVFNQQKIPGGKSQTVFLTVKKPIPILNHYAMFISSEIRVLIFVFSADYLNALPYYPCLRMLTCELVHLLL